MSDLIPAIFFGHGNPLNAISKNVDDFVKTPDTATLLFWIVLAPFLKKPMTSLWLSRYIAKELDAKKDTYYRLLNNDATSD